MCEHNEYSESNQDPAGAEVCEMCKNVKLIRALNGDCVSYYFLEQLLKFSLMWKTNSGFMLWTDLQQCNLIVI